MRQRGFVSMQLAAHRAAGGAAAQTAHLFVEVLLPRQVGDRRVDTAAEILENHRGGFDAS